MNRIPIVLVTGFLGSGKTTFLKQLAAAHPSWRLVFLVNEYADTSVDGDTLAATGTPTHSVVGGSLFCECKAADFVRTMREDVLAWHEERTLDAVIIETSGTADPVAIGKMMHDHGLGGDFEVRQIASVVAPATFLKLVRNLPVVESQIRASDLVIINKTDTADEPTLRAVEEAARELAPVATIQRAQQCLFAYELPSGQPVLPGGDLATCDANPFSTVELEGTDPGTVEDAQAWLANLPTTILRVKGRIRTDDGYYHVERTLDGLSIEPTEPGEVRLILIAHDDHEADLQRILNDVTQRTLPRPA